MHIHSAFVNVLRYTTLLPLFWLAACTTEPHAPVVDRTPNKPITNKPATNKPAPTKPTAPADNEKDWRPDSYVVKKGDTLFSIGLEFGYDYKDIASANGISAPYLIKVGQTLKLSSLKPKSATKSGMSKSKEGAPTSTSAQDDVANEVVITPIKTDGAPAGSSAPSVSKSTANTEASPPTSNSPDALPSTELPPKQDTKTKTENQAKPETATKATIVNDEDITWGWPTAGKVIKAYADSGSKGIDIAGTQGQAIMAAANGKVIYSGSDLRGYGKLVIIKHNSNYLSVYAHNHQILVKEGQSVQKLQKIAEMGNTDSEQTKLHFEIRKQGKSIDPSPLLGAR